MKKTLLILLLHFGFSATIYITPEDLIQDTIDSANDNDIIVINHSFVETKKMTLLK